MKVYVLFAMTFIYKQEKMKTFKNLLILMTSLLCLFFILSNKTFAEKPIHPDYPYDFDVTGKLDRISREKLVIDDTLYKLSSSVTYHAPDKVFTNLLDFHVQDTVGVLLKGKNEIVSIWLIKKK